MKKELHPESKIIEVKCTSCGAVFNTKSTANEIKVDTCANCHPFFTGSDSGASKAGRAEAFSKKFAHVLNNKETKAKEPQTEEIKEDKKED